MELLISAIGLVLILEGLPYFINPDGMKNMAQFMSTVESKTLRTAGFVLMLTGLVILYVFYRG